MKLECDERVWANFRNRAREQGHIVRQRGLGSQTSGLKVRNRGSSGRITAAELLQ